MTQTRFEDRALVEAWLKEPTWLEPVDEDRVAAIVHQTPQVRRWPPQLDLGRFAPMLNATKFVAASVILALTGGLLLTTLPTEPTAGPVPAAETATATATATPRATSATETEPPRTIESTGPIITLPDELPEGVESGTIDTPAGPIRWVRLDTSDPEAVVPRWVGPILPWGDGIAVPGNGSLYVTHDGVAWTLASESVPGFPTYVDGTFVVVDTGGDRVWISSGPGSGWQELDAMAMADARIKGWKASPGRRVAAGPMSVDDRIIFVVQQSYRLPVERLGIPPRKNKAMKREMKRLGNGRYALCGGGRGTQSCEQLGEDAKWVLQFEEQPKGLAVIDDRTGERLGLLEGASADQLYQGVWARHNRIFAIEGGAVVEINSPWRGLGPGAVANRTVAPGSESPIVALWWDRLHDADTPGAPAIVSEVPAGGTLQIETFLDRLTATSRGPDGTYSQAWRSVDGVEWVPAPDGVPRRADLRWTGSAWLAARRTGASIQHWLHLGGEWVSLDALELGDYPAAGIGNLTVVGGGDELWVLEHPTGE